MMYDYDTQAIRRTARHIKNTAGELEQLANGLLARLQAQSEAGFEGRAADALQDVLAQMRQDIRRISSGLNGVQSQLNTFARKVEEADAKIARGFAGGGGGGGGRGF